MAETWAPVPQGNGFTLANLPYGVIGPPGAQPRVAVRIGDHALDLAAVGIAPDLTARSSLNDLMASGRGSEIRARAGEVLTGPERPDLLVDLSNCAALLPFAVADYVDYYSSIHHATNLGRILRPGTEPLMPNWRRIPIGYHGRAGSVVVSGTPITRPAGMVGPVDGPRVAPSEQLDIELEVGFVVGRPGSLLQPDDAGDHVFGVVMLNDWSARDIQAFEYQPLGPNLAKSFATTISAWVVTLDALRPFLVPSPVQDPPPADYLAGTLPWALDLRLRVELNDTVVSNTGFGTMYWTFAQQLAHMTVNGAVTHTGDLFGSGTVSGPTREERGSLIELTWRGAEPLTLADGSTRAWLQDGDTVTLRGCAGGDHRPLICLGEATGTIIASPSDGSRVSVQTKPAR